MVNQLNFRVKLLKINNSSTIDGKETKLQPRKSIIADVPDRQIPTRHK